MVPYAIACSREGLGRLGHAAACASFCLRQLFEVVWDIFYVR